MKTALTLVLSLAVLACGPAGEDGADTLAGDSVPAMGSGTDTTGGSAGAANTQGGVTLSVDKTSYRPGDAVVMRIVSQRSDTLGYNPCSNRTVEREAAGAWTAHPEPNRVCTMELRLLMPGETQSATTDLPADITAGSYRISLRLHPQGSSGGAAVTAVSAPFQVSMP